MRRIRLDELAQVSLAVCALLALLWVVSHVAPDGADFRGAGDRFPGDVTASSVALAHGRFGFARLHNAGAIDGPVWPDVVRAATPTSPRPWNHLGFAAQRVTRVPAAGPGPGGVAVATGWAATCPVWLFVAMSGVLPALWLRDVRRRRTAERLRGQGRCRRCGYDLTGSASRCPECGWEFVRLR